VLTDGQVQDALADGQLARPLVRAGPRAVVRGGALCAGAASHAGTLQRRAHAPACPSCAPCTDTALRRTHDHRYNTYATHFKENEAMRQTYEGLLLQVRCMRLAPGTDGH
jgi:hypothetical protein